MKPNFLVIGAAKCATTSLSTRIGQHHDAFMCTPKEPFFFSHDKNYVGKGWEWYESLFKEAEGKSAVGEGSVTYTMQSVFPEAAPRIAKHLPDAKLIYITRNPIEQIESLWMMLRSFWSVHWNEGVRTPSKFNRAVRETPMLLEAARFRKQIQWYREYFPKESILVLFYDDFRKNPNEVLNRCFKFLEIDSNVTISDADRPMTITANHSYDRWFFKPMRMIPGIDVIRHAIPTRVRTVIKPIARRSGMERPRWEGNTRRWVVDQLREDTEQFLADHDKPSDMWTLEATSLSNQK